MADLDFVFNPDEVEDRPEIGILPVGEYIAQVTESDYKVNKKGTGKFIALTFEIIDGEYVGRKYFDNLNVQHENKTAMDIANSSLKELLVAAGLAHKPFTSTTVLHNIPVKLVVRITPRKDTGEPQNQVRYKSVNAQPRSVGGPKLVASGGPAQAQAGVPATAPKKKPWEK